MDTRVLVNGISGLNRCRIFDHPLVRDHMDVYQIGELMGQIAQESGQDYTESRILRAPSGTLAALRAAAVERIIRLLADPSHGTRPQIISCHSVFLLTDRIIEGMRVADLKALKPSRLITLIDGPQFIHECLKAHEGDYFHLTVESIVRWQEFEVFLAQHFAEDLGIEHFVVPVNQPCTFASLIDRPLRPRKAKSEPVANTGSRLSGCKPLVYVSHPMQYLPKDMVPRVREFATKLQNSSIVFDPSAIDSSDGLSRYSNASDRNAILNHTIVRDMDWFIGINKAKVVAYWPSEVHSSGMSDELRYAYETGRDTYLVTESLSQNEVPALSPFTTYKSKVFGSSEEFFAFWLLPGNLQNVYMIIQSEMLNVIRAGEETRKRMDIEAFRAECAEALRNALPDEFLHAHEGQIKSLIDQVYDRWSPARCTQ